MIELELGSEQAMLDYGAQLARVVGDMAVICLSGQLGAGKTTLTRGFLRGLGYEGNVKSPTYTLVEAYNFNHLTVYHFDFYRVKDAEELEFMGIRDYFAPNTICIIEWPEYAQGVLPQNDLTCNIKLLNANDGREIKIEAHTVHGEDILQRLTNE